MVKNGIGGSNTKVGITFQENASMINVLSKISSYNIKSVDGNKGEFNVIYKGNHVAKIFQSYSIYKFLKNNHNVDWKIHISKRLIPDDAIFVYSNNVFHVIEVKSQTRSGSVDEKLQTCDFKKKQWQKLLGTLNCQVKYFYILNDWFKKPEYKDMLDYVISHDCRYFFNYIPLNELGLKLA